MMLSRLRRWFARARDNSQPAPGRAPKSDAREGTASSDAVRGGDGTEPLLSERELSSRYCAGLFATRHQSEGSPGPEERAWLREHRERLMEDPTAFTARVPRLPRIAPRLMATLRDPEQYGSKEIAKMVESDPVLAGNMLKVVNSPSVRPNRKEIVSIEQAVTILGNRGMREVVAAAIISPIAQFGQDRRLNSEGLRQIWPETLQTAMNVKVGARHIGGGVEGFALHLSALTHSSGLMVLLRNLDTLEVPTVSSGFIDELESLARNASVAIAQHWDFDEDSVRMLQGWADSDRSTLETALLIDAIGFTRINNLCRRGELGSSSCQAYLDALPRFANEWKTSPSEPG